MHPRHRRCYCLLPLFIIHLSLSSLPFHRHAHLSPTSLPFLRHAYLSPSSLHFHPHHALIPIFNPFSPPTLSPRRTQIELVDLLMTLFLPLFYYPLYPISYASATQPDRAINTGDCYTLSNEPQLNKKRTTAVVQRRNINVS
jgi:hypothetical protein